MADIIDDANDLAEFHLQSALNNKAPEGPGHTGFCLNCDEPLSFPERWCDSDCREDWDRLNKARSHVRLTD